MAQWFSRLFGTRRTALRTETPHLSYLAQNHHPESASSSFGSIYTQSPWVYVAVNRIAEAAALVPLKVYALEGETRREVIDHPVERLLDAPNPRLSRFELIEQTIGALELYGNAYWYLAGDGLGRPAEIWPLRPDRVSVVPDPAQHVRGYVYSIAGQDIPLEAIEVIHFRRWHPLADYTGLSALSAARMAVENDAAMARWNANTFGRDQGVPAGIVAVRDGMSDADFNRIQREWRENYGSGQRRTAFLRGASIEWHNIGLNHSDMDFIQGRRAQRDEILNIFGIPAGLVAENATEANARVAERQFIERTLWPKLVRLAQKISQELLPFYPGRHIAVFEDIRPTDTRARLNEIQSAQSVLSINEIRARFYDLPPVPWGALPPASDTRQDTPEQAELTPAAEPSAIT